MGDPRLQQIKALSDGLAEAIRPYYAALPVDLQADTRKAVAMLDAAHDAVSQDDPQTDQIIAVVRDGLMRFLTRLQPAIDAIPAPAPPVVAPPPPAPPAPVAPPPSPPVVAPVVAPPPPVVGPSFADLSQELVDLATAINPPSVAKRLADLQAGVARAGLTATAVEVQRALEAVVRGDSPLLDPAGGVDAIAASKAITDAFDKEAARYPDLGGPLASAVHASVEDLSLFTLADRAAALAQRIEDEVGEAEDYVLTVAQIRSDAAAAPPEDREYRFRTTRRQGFIGPAADALNEAMLAASDPVAVSVLGGLPVNTTEQIAPTPMTEPPSRPDLNVGTPPPGPVPVDTPWQLWFTAPGQTPHLLDEDAAEAYLRQMAEQQAMFSPVGTPQAAPANYDVRRKSALAPVPVPPAPVGAGVSGEPSKTALLGFIAVAAQELGDAATNHTLYAKVEEALEAAIDAGQYEDFDDSLLIEAIGEWLRGDAVAAEDTVKLWTDAPAALDLDTSTEIEARTVRGPDGGGTAWRLVAIVGATSAQQSGAWQDGTGYSVLTPDAFLAHVGPGPVNPLNPPAEVVGRVLRLDGGFVLADSTFVSQVPGAKKTGGAWSLPTPEGAVTGFPADDDDTILPGGVKPFFWLSGPEGAIDALIGTQGAAVAGNPVAVVEPGTSDATLRGQFSAESDRWTDWLNNAFGPAGFTFTGVMSEWEPEAVFIPAGEHAGMGTLAVKLATVEGGVEATVDSALTGLKTRLVYTVTTPTIDVTVLTRVLVDYQKRYPNRFGIDFTPDATVADPSDADQRVWASAIRTEAIRLLEQTKAQGLVGDPITWEGSAA